MSHNPGNAPVAPAMKEDEAALEGRYETLRSDLQNEFSHLADQDERPADHLKKSRYAGQMFVVLHEGVGHLPRGTVFSADELYGGVEFIDRGALRRLRRKRENWGKDEKVLTFECQRFLNESEVDAYVDRLLTLRAVRRANAFESTQRHITFAAEKATALSTQQTNHELRAEVARLRAQVQRNANLQSVAHGNLVEQNTAASPALDRVDQNQQNISEINHSPTIEEADDTPEHLRPRPVPAGDKFADKKGVNPESIANPKDASNPVTQNIPGRRSSR